MQALLAIPSLETAEALTRRVAGVPLLVRVLATAVRAGVDSVLVIWPEHLEPANVESSDDLPKLNGLTIRKLTWSGAFDPRNASHWKAISTDLADRFVWLPWNWVTHRRALEGLPASAALPSTWERPVLMDRHLVLQADNVGVSDVPSVDGLPVLSAGDARAAERWLVERSGKVTDGIYSSFNRYLCRPAVRCLSRTEVTPNALTLAGLLVAILSAELFARGSYLNYVAGAVLFFVSGLFDEMDGMIARIKFRESPFGTWFEGFVDNFTYLLVFAGITLGLYRQYGTWALQYGIALIVGCILSVAVIAVQRTLATKRDRPHEYAGKMHRLMEADSSNLISRVVRQVHIFVKKGVLVHYLLIFTVLGGLPVFLWLAAVGSNITWIVTLYFTRRFFDRPTLEPTLRSAS